MKEKYLAVRRYTEKICSHLVTEDYGLQPIVEVSPPKWHLAHTTWFFETFLLKPFLKDYIEYHPHFSFLFNSYYQSLGERNPRSNRSNFSRPTVKEIYQYRAYVDKAMENLLDQLDSKNEKAEIIKTLILGFNHEQQHQELLLTDIKFILSINLEPPAVFELGENKPVSGKNTWISIPEGVHRIGFEGEGFYWDNELGSHSQYLNAFQIQSRLTTNREFIEFMDAGGYYNFNYWHDEGWSWVQNESIHHPLYWVKIENAWFTHTLAGIQPLEMDAPLTHISFYEAFAFSQWKGLRLPTEFEWEAASIYFDWGERWEWTLSAYLPYPGFKKSEGAIGEYNGKFMVNQMVLRGASCATPKDHSRNTYRNFFHPSLRWQFTGLRLAQ